MIGTPNYQDIYNQECHIIGIGIDKYKFKNSWTVLKNCETDVEKFIDKTCSFFKTFEDTPERVVRLYNANAERSLIETTIKGKINSLKKHQNLIIYFAGHGVDYDKKAYLAPYDAQGEYLYPNKSKLISFDDIFNWIDNKEALHVVLILDCCRGGMIMNAKRATTEKYSYEEYLDEHIGSFDFETMMNKKSAWVITSGSYDQTVSDGDKNGSPFSTRLIDMLNGSRNFNRPISIAQLGSTLKHRFPNKYKQKPDFKHLSDILGYEQIGGEFVFEPKPRIRESLEPVKPHSPLVELEQEPEPKVEPVLDVKPSIPIFDKPLPEQPVFDIHPIQYQDGFIERITGYVQNSLNSEQNVYPKKKRIFGTAWFFLLTLCLLFFVIGKVFSKEIGGFWIALTTIEKSPKSLNGTEGLVDTPWHPALPPPVVPPTLPPPAEPPKPSIPSKPVKGLNKPFYTHNEKDTIKDNLVFVGSFQIKDNAEALKQRLQNNGYQKTEIVMKEDLPYAVVVTGFHDRNKAKAEVKAIKKKGIEVYSSKTDLSKIYRKKNY